MSRANKKKINFVHEWKCKQFFLNEFASDSLRIHDVEEHSIFSLIMSAVLSKRALKVIHVCHLFASAISAQEWLRNFEIYDDKKKKW